MTAPVRRLLAGLAGALQRRLLGVSADEIRYTFDDVRAEVRATRAELLAEIAAVRAEVDRLADRQREDVPRGPEIPVAEA